MINTEVVLFRPSPNPTSEQYKILGGIGVYFFSSYFYLIFYIQILDTRRTVSIYFYLWILTNDSVKNSSCIYT